MSSILDTMSSKWSNFKYTIVLASFKFRKRTKIAILETKALRLQSKFGTDCLNLMRKGAPERTLQLRLEPTMREFNDLRDKVDEIEKLVKEKEKQINKKLGVVVDIPSPPPKLVETSPTCPNTPSSKSLEHPPTHIIIDESGYTYVGIDESMMTTGSERKSKRKKSRPRQSKSPISRKARAYLKVDGSDHTAYIDFHESIKTTTSEPKTKKKKPKSKSKSKPKQGKSPEHKSFKIDDTARASVRMDKSKPTSRKRKSSQQRRF